ncbi:MAG: Holliday junction resolvase RuvX [Bacteroidia bacterium]|nr:Holliday junction resolvase RuvX [Bacteroidia bacterium]
MARILAIDYGTKRVGIAVTDPLKIIANGLDTVHSKDIFVFLENYLKKEAVECIVVGWPKTLMNTPSSNAHQVKGFIRLLKEKFPTVKIESVDERFTSQMALQSMIDGGMKKKDRQNKEMVDMISATLILQTWLQMEGNMG